VAVIVLPFDFRQAILNSLIGTVLVLSLVVITGFVGQISVMQLALSGIAGFAISHLATDVGITFPAAPLLGAFAATAVGLISALSALRIRGVTLSVVTLAAAVAIQAAVFTNSTIGGGFRGADVPPPQIFGFNIGNDASFRGIDGKLPSSLFALLILAATIVACLTVASIRRSNFGQRMLAVRSNERAAAAVGINVRNVKLAAFCIGSFIAGLAGAMYAYNFGSISATRFGALTALSLIAFAYIGGITMVSGAIIAGFLATEGLSQHAVETWFGVSGTWTILLAGITLIFNLVFYPEGIAGANYKKKQHKKQLRAAGIKQHSALRTVLNRRRGNPVPPATAPAPNRET
jgi:branched-chain amino acid transport system permease protein